MTSFDCSECGAPAFADNNDINFHGTPGEIDFDTDRDHVALDPTEIANTQ